MGLAYRVKQFFRTLRPQLDPDVKLRVHSILDPRLADLFFRMSSADQAHSIRVLDALLGEENGGNDLLGAALLHDVGKSVYPPSILDRIIIVLAHRFFPRVAASMGANLPKGWRRPFAIANQHPRWGADLAAAHGASPLLVELILRHHDPLPDDPRTRTELMLKNLRRVDSEN